MASLKYQKFDSNRHSVRKPVHKEMEAIRWMEHEQSKDGFDTESNASLAKRQDFWNGCLPNSPDPKWGGATPEKLGNPGRMNYQIKQTRNELNHHIHLFKSNENIQKIGFR